MNYSTMKVEDYLDYQYGSLNMVRCKNFDKQEDKLANTDNYEIISSNFLSHRNNM